MWTKFAFIRVIIVSTCLSQSAKARSAVPIAKVLKQVDEIQHDGPPRFSSPSINASASARGNSTYEVEIPSMAFVTSPSINAMPTHSELSGGHSSSSFIGHHIHATPTMQSDAAPLHELGKVFSNSTFVSPEEGGEGGDCSSQSIAECIGVEPIGTCPEGEESEKMWTSGIEECDLLCTRQNLRWLDGWQDIVDEQNLARAQRLFRTNYGDDVRTAAKRFGEYQACRIVACGLEGLTCTTEADKKSFCNGTHPVLRRLNVEMRLSLHAYGKFDFNEDLEENEVKTDYCQYIPFTRDRSTTSSPSPGPSPKPVPSKNVAFSFRAFEQLAVLSVLAIHAVHS